MRTILFLGRQGTGKTSLVKALCPTYDPPKSSSGLARTIVPMQVDYATPFGEHSILDCPALDGLETFPWEEFVKQVKPWLVILVTGDDMAPVDVRVQEVCARALIPIWLVRNKVDEVPPFDSRIRAADINPDAESQALSRFKDHVLTDMIRSVRLLAAMPIFVVSARHPEKYEFRMLKRMLNIKTKGQSD